MGFQLSEIRLLGLPRHRQMLLSRIKMKVLLNLPVEIKKLFFYGNKHFCPVCESHLRSYERFGHIANLWCPICASMRWQRLAWVFLKHHTNIFDEIPKRMLHVAPELAFESRLKQVNNLDYLTADLYDSRAMVQMDVTNIPFPDHSFNAIFCSHVMEHVPNDRKAFSEFIRVLLPNGWAILLVPINMNKLTDEDPEVTDPKERERRFGQSDHVRMYGWDLEERLREAGFQVTLVKATNVIKEDKLDYMGINAEEVLFYCHKSGE